MALGDLNGAHFIQLVVAGVVEEDPCINLRVGGHAQLEVDHWPPTVPLRSARSSRTSAKKP